MSFSYYEDPILGKGRAQVDVGGGTGGGGEPLVGGNGITLAGGTITATVAAVDGGRLTLSGGTATFNPVANIVSASGATVTLNPDTAYKVFATTQAVTLNANVPASGQWGLEGHIELFVAGTGYVVTGSNVVLANALEPDAVNNCTVRFHDGLAIISVEDHVAGYIVTVNAASGAGSLAYGLATATNEYISVDASLNGQMLDLAGATTYAGEKHVVGNGYTETIISGGITCTSKTTFSNLSMDGVSVNGGIMTLGDVFIPSGSTVSVSGGGLAVEKVTGAGGTIDLGGTSIELGKWNIPYTSASFSSVTITSGGSGSTYPAAIVAANGEYDFIDVKFHDNTTGYFSACMLATTGGTVSCSGCVFDDKVSMNDSSAKIVLRGSNNFPSKTVAGNTGNVTLTSGAILDLTGNTNATPINPGGGITFEPGGATVYPSAGQANAYMLGGVTVPKITNTTTVDLGGTNVTIASGTTASASGCTFSGGATAYNGGAVLVPINRTLELNSCTVTGNAGASGGGLAVELGVCTLIDCIVSGNTATAGNTRAFGRDMLLTGSCLASNTTVGYTTLGNGGHLTLAGNCTIDTVYRLTANNYGSVTISSGASINLTLSIEPLGGITVLEGGCTVNGVTVEPGTYTSIVSSGGSAVINQ